MAGKLGVEYYVMYTIFLSLLCWNTADRDRDSVGHSTCVGRG